jgi:hypothetical protein
MEPSDAVAQLSMAVLDMIEENDVDDVIIGGVVLAVRTSSGEGAMLLRCTSSVSPARIKLWAQAADMDLDSLVEVSANKMRMQRERIEELEEQADGEWGTGQ